MEENDNRDLSEETKQRIKEEMEKGRSLISIVIDEGAKELNMPRKYARNILIGMILGILLLIGIAILAIFNKVALIVFSLILSTILLITFLYTKKR